MQTSERPDLLPSLFGKDDELIEVKTTDNTRDILLVTKYGQCIRFHETGRPARQEELPWESGE